MDNAYDPLAHEFAVIAMEVDAPALEALRQAIPDLADRLLTPAQLLDALQQARGHGQGTDAGPADSPPAEEWPGATVGLSCRESEIVSLITQGMPNKEISGRTFLSLNTVKSYIRSAYQKMGVSSRTTAVLWALDHGFSSVRRPKRPNR